jgi:hypothetical protein
MRHVLVGLAVVSACVSSPRPRPSLVTTAEQSGFVRTGRHDEVIRLCHEFARAYAEVTCLELGRTGQDRPIVALVLARRPTLPVVYVQAGIHAGEIEGKDAGFVFLRDLLDGKVAPGALDAVAVVFVPVLNPDGHERFGPNHRPNQRGPEEMGFRTNAARQNLNRDYVKADTPEIQAVLRLVRERDPVLLVDLHCTDGAKFEHDISIVGAPIAPRGDGLDVVGRDVRDRVVARLAELGHLPVSFYPSFRVEDDPLSGFSSGEAPPRFSQAYAAARGRLGILVETHSWRTYPERVKATYHTLQAVFEEAAGRAAAWRDATAAASRADAALAGTRVTLAWKPGARASEIAFRGYAFEKRASEISGGTWLHYDEGTPQLWRVPLHDELEPALELEAPRGGYIIDGGFARMVAEVLDHHGLAYVPIAGEPRLDVEAFRAARVTHHPPFEGRTRVTLEGSWARETRTLDRGAIFVPIEQPYARLVMHLLEPALPDSLVQWGHFNTCFEQKEYMERYVIEEQARVMLERDPALRGQFEAALAADPELAASPARRLAWFYRRHPAWDDRVDLVPVFRTATDLRARR